MLDRASKRPDPKEERDQRDPKAVSPFYRGARLSDVARERAINSEALG